MKPSRINDQESLKKEKKRLKEEIQLKKELIQLDLSVIKDRISPVQAAKDYFVSFINSPEFKTQLLHTTLQVGLARTGNIFAKKKQKVPSFVGMLGRNLFWSYLPYYITALSNAAGLYKKPTVVPNVTETEFIASDVTVIVEEKAQSNDN